MISQADENAAFLGVLLYRGRVAIESTKALHPTWKFKIEQGPPSVIPATTHNIPSPPADFLPKFTLLVAEVNLFRSGHNVRLTAGPNVVGDPIYTYSASGWQTGTSLPPGVPYDPVKPLPSPQPAPACIPCLSTIVLV